MIIDTALHFCGMKKAFIFIFLGIGVACSSQTEEQVAVSSEQLIEDQSSVTRYYLENRQDSLTGKSFGTVSNGHLENGTLIPFEGSNFFYFDTTSYLSARAFTHQDVLKTLLDTYMELEKLTKHRFGVMELSNKEGGEIFPHHTHQNGMSVDLMTPLLKNGLPFDSLDHLGANHYMLDFDNQGRYVKDPDVTIDFDLIALHLINLDKMARKNGLKIDKVIWKMELCDELYNTPNGQGLKSSGIYITRKLTPLINSLHDDHYHVDFTHL